MDICLIWAQARNGAIGRQGDLPWRLPEDLKRFKEKTLGHWVLMGRKTFDSLPPKGLPGRKCLVVSRGAAQDQADIRFLPSLEASFEALKDEPLVYVIGGAQIYQQTMAYATRLDVTDVDVDVPDGDAFAPLIPREFAVTKQSGWNTSTTGLRYRHTEWARTL